MVKDLVALPAYNCFRTTSSRPVSGVFDDLGADQIQIDISQAASKVVIGANGGGVIAVLPKGTFAGFSLIELLRHAAGNPLHAFGNLPAAAIHNQ